MAKRIVVGLDGSDYAANATRIACEAAQRLGSTLVGVAVVDTPAIEASSRGAGIGSYEYAKRVREERLGDAHQHAAQFLDAFEQSCRTAGVACERAMHESAPDQAIVSEGRYADMIVVGLRTYFHYETQEEPGDTAHMLMRVCVCPVLAVPQECPMPINAVIACDGSLQSARALRAFVHLAAMGPRRGKIVLLHVGQGDEEDQMVQLDTAQRYMEAHGFDATMECRRGRAPAVIEQVAEENSPSVIVMGAYGRRGVIRGLFFGSTAAGMIKHERFPLFVYH